MTKYYIGKTFTANPAGVVSNPKSTTAYQWLSESLPITGETSLIYTTSIVDENKQLQVRQIETNRFGFDSAVSAAVEVNTSSYGITDTEPYILCDFLNDYYRKGYADSTFDSVCVYSTTTLNTMFDSDGILKWAPHNFFEDSHDITGPNWNLIGITLLTGQADPVGGNNAVKLVSIDGNNGQHRINQQNTFPTIGPQATISAVVKAGEWDIFWFYNNVNGGAAYFDLTNGTIGTVSGNYLDSRITSLGDGWYVCEIDMVGHASNDPSMGFSDTESLGANGDGVSGGFIYAVTNYRSDDLAMVNPYWDGTTGLENYVPTTTDDVVKPRRNAYYYNGSAWTNGGLLLESAAATNLIAESLDFSTTWTSNNATLTADDATGPRGSSTMTKLNDDSGTGTGEVYVDYSVTVSTSTSYVFSVAARADQLQWIALGTENFTTPANGETFFNLSDGTVGTTASGHTTYVEQIGANVYRCSIVFTTDSSDTTGNLRVYLADADTDITVDLDGTSSVHIDLAQFETGTLPSSFIITDGATATRAAQTLTIDYSDIIDIGGVKMQGQVSFTDQDTPTQHTFWRRYKDGNEYISVTMDTDSSTNAELNFIQSNGGNVGAVVLSTEYAPGILTHYNFSSSHGTNTINGNDGTDTGTADTTSDTLPTFTTQDLDIGYDYSGNISAFAIFENTLSDSLLGEASVDYNFWLYGDNINTTGLWVDSTGWD